MSKFAFLRLTVVAAFVCLWGRLFTLQVVQGEELRAQAEQNTSYLLTIVAPRGLIYDRRGRVLVSNKHAPSLIVLPSVLRKQIADLSRISELLATILEVQPEDLLNTLESMDHSDSRPKILHTGMSVEQVAAFYEHRHQLPGMTVQKQAARFYPYGDTLAHVLGYTGRIDREQLAARPERSLNDLVGQYGLEKTYDDHLRGHDKHKRIWIDRDGQPVEPIDLQQVSEGAGTAGKDLHLTIDLELQQAAEKALGDLKGAVVAVDPRSGEVLAMASRPTFDPNLFAVGISSASWKSLNSPDRPFLNRAISAYPPGSIWKPLVLLAALESGEVKPDEKFWVSGAYYLNGYRFGDWTDETGSMGLTEALAWSRDTAFYKIGHRIGDKTITRWAKKFGIGEPTGLNLPQEDTGTLPTPRWQKANLRGWYPGNTLHYSIGQGYLLATPAQMARYTSGLATGEKVPGLHVVADRQPDTLTLDSSRESLELVRKGMVRCVRSATCWAGRVPGVASAGKTGSAEDPPNEKTHGWYITYAPVADPEIAVVVFAEAAGHGGSVAAPIASKVLKAYFGQERRPATLSEPS